MSQPSPPLYRIRRSRRAKRLALRLDPIERVFNLVVPDRCSLPAAYDFADQYEGWMLTRLQTLPPAVPFIDGAILPLNGTNVTLDIIRETSRKNTQLSLQGSRLIVRTNQADASVRVARWCKTYALNTLKQKSEEKTLSIGKTIKKVSVRETKSRWGSCAADGALSYSWRLIFAPPEALDYVVAHEVAHLVHLNHSKAFWTLCRTLSHDFTTGQNWMRTHGSELMRYGIAAERPTPLAE
ncbi:MAG: M48 family metallopeptidase [Rhodospirillales bacterium]|nr:M48 family metallopeptidase [Rhodospirillales bacterium]